MSSRSIEHITTKDYAELRTVWEASVRASHHFITEADIQDYKQLLSDEIFNLLQLHCVKAYDTTGNARICGFIGVHNRTIDMLFVHPDYFGKGTGSFLLNFAIAHLECTTVEVNEHNTTAYAFYKKFGFNPVSRKEKDALGKPYPILDLERK